MTKIYVVVAYRYGATNDDTYFVYVGTNRADASKCAQEEPDYRGGKYGCAVFEFEDKLYPMYGDEEGLRELPHENIVEYYSSLVGEKKPQHNWHKDFMHTVGFEAERFVNGEAWLPEEDPAIKDWMGNPIVVLKPHAVTPPDWFVERFKHHKDFYDAMQKAHD